MATVSKADLKRQNFNVTPDQEAEIAWLQQALDAPTAKDAILRAIRVVSVLAREVRQGKKIVLQDASGETLRVLIPELESRLAEEEWKHLAPRPGSSRRQYYFRGKRLPASSVWADMIANNATVEETAENWDLTVDQVREAIRYCETHKDIIEREFQAEWEHGAEAAGLKTPYSGA